MYHCAFTRGAFKKILTYFIYFDDWQRQTRHRHFRIRSRNSQKLTRHRTIESIFTPIVEHLRRKTK